MNGADKCHYCGAAVNAVDHFCGNCGQARAEQLREQPTQEQAGTQAEGTPTSGPAPGSNPAGEVPPRPQPPMPGPQYAMSPPWAQPATATRYGSLRTIATIFTVIGLVVIVVGTVSVIAFAASVNNISSGGRIGVLVLGLIYVALYALSLIAAGAFIRLMLSIEQSARETAQSAREAVGLLVHRLSFDFPVDRGRLVHAVPSPGSARRLRSK